MINYNEKDKKMLKDFVKRAMIIMDGNTKSAAERFKDTAGKKPLFYND